VRGGLPFIGPEKTVAGRNESDLTVETVIGAKAVGGLKGRKQASVVQGEREVATLPRQEGWHAGIAVENEDEARNHSATSITPKRSATTGITFTWRSWRSAKMLAAVMDSKSTNGYTLAPVRRWKRA
jgi:hypothetical protein